MRLTALTIAAAGHDTLAKLAYARNLPAGGGPIASRHTGAQLMYYGGTIIEVALAAVVMTQWYLASGRALAWTRRRSQSAGPQLPIALPSRRRSWAPLPLSQLGRIGRGARAGHKRPPVRLDLGADARARPRSRGRHGTPPACGRSCWPPQVSRPAARPKPLLTPVMSQVRTVMGLSFRYGRRARPRRAPVAR